MDPPEDLETLVEGYPFYFISSKTDKDGNKMALTMNRTEIYWPRRFPVFNVYLDKWSGKEHPNPR